MSVFHHPHLTRGIVKTPKGSFVIVRGLVEVPDEIGDALGWDRVDLESQPPAAAQASSPKRKSVAGDRGVSARPAALRQSEHEARARMIRAKAASFRSRQQIQAND
jgi:hypothetical protein